MNEGESWSDYIIRKRARLHLDKKQFGKLVGVTGTQVGHWELGNHKPWEHEQPKFIEKIEALTIPPEDVTWSLIVKDLRKKIGLDLQRFANRLGIKSGSVVSSWESENIIPLPRNQRRIKQLWLEVHQWEK